MPPLSRAVIIFAMLVIPISSALHKTFSQIARDKRMVFFSGLPGVGKSLLIQQLALLASQAGRIVHTVHWDVSRAAFETPDIQQRYPEIDGVTHAAIRKAVGIWSRDAIRQWDEAYPEAEHILIGEVPLLGSRLIELAVPHDDEAEALLTGEGCLFVVPVPSWEVRAVIEQSRARTFTEPQHEKERLDASPDVLRALWREINSLARRINLTKAAEDAPYNPYIYGGVYAALLRHRPHQLILIDEVLRPAKSVYELQVVTSQLQADLETVNAIFDRLENEYTPAEVEELVDNWHAIITDTPRHADAGPELFLPAPELLPGSATTTNLTAAQRTALRELLALPLEADTAQVVTALDKALATFALADRPDPVLANSRKFDVYDSYFNVQRTDADTGPAFLAGLLQAYRNVLQNLAVPPDSLTVLEAPLLRIALETAIRTFTIEETDV